MDKLAVLRAEYFIRTVSDNPLNSEGRLDAAEARILNRFRAADSAGKIVESGALRGPSYLISAAPDTARKAAQTELFRSLVP